MFEYIIDKLIGVELKLKKLKRKIAKKLKGYKTLLFNVLSSAVPLISVINPYDLNLSPQNLAYFIMFITVINIYLRFKTNTAIGQKK